jgi:hypothetical protein
MESYVLAWWVVLILSCYALCDGKSLQGSESDVDALLDVLFPSGVPEAFNSGDTERESRSLAIDKKGPWDPDNPVPCAVCTGLKLCPVLNGLMVEEVYYPKDPGKKETCNVIEALGKRVSNDIFGNGRTFRDTDQCRGEEGCATVPNV